MIDFTGEAAVSREWLERSAQTMPPATALDEASEACGAILICAALGQLDRLSDAARLAWIEHLRSALRDHPPSANESASRRTIAHAFEALCPDDVVGEPSAVMWHAAEPALWQKPVAAATELGIWLDAEIARAEAFDDSQSQARVRAALAGLDAAQDATTGLWGDFSASSEAEAIIATAILLQFYRYLHRPILRTSRIRETVLLATDVLAPTDPLRPLHEWAVAETLSTVLLLVGPRDQEIAERLLALANEIDARPALPAANRFETWLRFATLAKIRTACGAAAVNGPEFWRSRMRPGVGYCPDPHTMSADERRAVSRWLPRFEETARPTRPAAPAATVVIPCFNMGMYLGEAVASVLAQTLDDVELIIVDDGSDDPYTLCVLDAMAAQGLCVVRQSNQGLAAARNAGVALAAAPYVACLDSDDRLRPDFLRRSREILAAERTIGFVNTSMQRFDELDDVVVAHPCEFPDMLVYNRAIVSAMFPKEAWTAVGGYYGGFSSTGIEDWDFWVRLLDHGYRAAVIEDVLFEYRVRGGSMSQGMYQPERWQQLMRELATRHVRLFDAHLTDVVAAVTRREAEVRAWAMEARAAVRWWERKTDAWRRVVGERDQTIRELRDWFEELERGKQWLEDQRQGWERTALAAEATVASQQKEILELREAIERSHQ
jgi:glycosyltransferase involved in cell wall biosynthesis